MILLEIWLACSGGGRTCVRAGFLKIVAYLASGEDGDENYGKKMGIKRTLKL